MRLRAGTQEPTLEDIGALQVWAFKHGHLWSGWIIGTDHRVAISSGHTTLKEALVHTARLLAQQRLKEAP